MHLTHLRGSLAVTALLVAGALSLAGCGQPSGNASKPGDSASPAGSASSVASASATPTPTPTPTVKVTPSPDLAKVTVTGEAGKKPTVKAPWPWGISTTTVKVLKAGDGATVADTGEVQINYIGINGRDGQAFDDSFTRGQPSTFNVGQVIPGFKKGLVGQKAGSRVLIGIPAVDGYGAQGNEQAGISGTDTLIFVVDVISTSLTAPSGTPVAPKPGLPTVTDVKGVPTITVPGTAAPTQLVVQPLIKGAGAAVKATDAISVNYTTVDYATGKVIESSYGSGPQTGRLSDLIIGWQKGLVGQTVGSRVLLVVPPAEGYPKGNATPSIAAGATLVYVIDILFTQPGA